ncbi:nuclear transport factor 2 family protein [Bacillus sp. BGMRC 2118]|nr:nuclear transport factor 2 family protein [Bacillus sp. BGMRC 2118]
MNSHTNKEKAIAFLQLVASGQVQDAYKSYINEDFRHHNPYFKGDRESLLLAMEESNVHSPDKVLEVKLAVQEKNIVTVFSHVKQKPEDIGGAVVHIFRFQDDKIVEMWDVGQQIPQESPNTNGMF